MLSVVLVCGQAACELQLPTYMSELVNTGIQQRGLTDAVPERITDEALSLLLPYLSEKQQERIASAYIETQPGIYALRDDLTDAERVFLSRAFSVGEWTLIYLIRDLPGAPDTGAASRGRTVADPAQIRLDEVQEAASDRGGFTETEIETARFFARRVPRKLATLTGTAFAFEFNEDAGSDGLAAEKSFMLRMGGRMALIAVAAAICALGVSAASARASAGLEKNLRTAVFQKIHRMSPQDAARFTQASLLSRTTSDITLVRSSLEASIRIMCFAFAMGIGGIFMGLAIDPPLDWIVAAAVAAAFAVILGIFHITRPGYRTVQNMIDRLNLVTEESVAGAPVIRAYGAQTHEEERYDAANDLLASTQLKINRVLSFLSPSFTIIVNMASLAVVWLGAFQVRDLSVEVGTIIAFMQYVSIVVASFVMIAGMFVIIPRVSVAAERILEVLRTPERRADEEIRNMQRADEDGLRAQNVRFRYEGAKRDALQGVSLTARPGEITGVIGKTGSGKSTLFSVLAGALEPQEGAVRAGGSDLRGLTVEELRGIFRVWPQEYGAAESGLKFREKMDGAKGAGGCVYLFDDSLPAHGAGETGERRKLLRRLSKRGAVLLASHSVRQIKDADRIYVMEDGRITAAGTHSQLLEKSAVYRELADAEEGDGFFA